MFLIRILAGLGIFAAVLFMFTQVVVPLWKDGLLFPAWQKVKETKEKKKHG